MAMDYRSMGAGIERVNPEGAMCAFWNTHADTPDVLDLYGISSNNPLVDYIIRIPNKESTTVADLGCGSGAGFRLFQDFRFIYAVDYAAQQLKLAAAKRVRQAQLMLEDFKTAVFNEKVDYAFFVLSLYPNYYDEFEEVLAHVATNVKSGGKIILVLPSLESKLFTIQLDLYEWHKYEHLSSEAINARFEALLRVVGIHPSGYTNFMNSGLRMKSWLKEELEFRLASTNLKLERIQKFPLDWPKNHHLPYVANLPTPWLWMLEIECP